MFFTGSENYKLKKFQKVERYIMEPPGMQQLEHPPDDSTNCTALLAASLPASTAYAYAVDSSRSVAEVQSHLDHFTRGTRRAERSH